MSTAPRVSVVCANHNYGHWIMSALESVRADPYPHKQMIVVDDGSTDGTVDQVVSWMQSPQAWTSPEGIPGVRGVMPEVSIPLTVIAGNPARGPSAARNVGIKALWGETDLFFNLDADDLYKPGKIARSVARWQEAPEQIGVVYTDYDCLGVPNGLLVRMYREPYNRQRLLQECIANPNSLISKQAFQVVGLFDEQMRTAEDWDFWIRVSRHLILAHIPESLVVMRVGGYNSTHTVPREVWQANWTRIREKLAKANG